MSWTNRILLALILAGAAAYWPREDIAIENDIDRARREELARLREDNQKLRQEIDEIEAEISAVSESIDSSLAAQDKDRELARIARDDLNMIRPGEVVFEFQSQGGQ